MLHFGVALDDGHHAAGFLAEDEARGVDGIAADIEEGAAAPGEHIADVGGVAIEVAEETHGGAQIADAAGADEIAGADPLGMGVHHEGLADFDAGAGLRLKQLAGFGGVERQRLLTEHVLAGFGGANGPGHVQVIRERVVDGLDFGIGQQFLVGAVGFRDAEIGGGLASSRQIAGGDSGDLAGCAKLHGRNHFFDGDMGGAQYAPTDFGYHFSCLLWNFRTMGV